MDVGYEVVSISATPDGAVVLTDDLGLSEEDFHKMLKSLFILSFSQLTKDLVSASGGIEISPDPMLKDLITMTRMIVSDSGEFQLLVYFGGLVDPSISLEEGLKHIVEVLATVREDLLEE